MKKMLITLTVCAMSMTAPAVSFAQTEAGAAAAQQGSLPGALAGTGLTAGAAAAIIGGLLFVGILSGGGDGTVGTTTTTTTTTSTTGTR